MRSPAAGPTPARLGEAIDVIRDLAEGREAEADGNAIRIPWIKDGKLPVWMAAYGPKALAHARDQCRRFGGTVGNHVADLVAKYGEHSSMVPEELTAYVKDRQGYDYSHHGRADNPDTAFALYDMHDSRPGPRPLAAPRG